jgi:hypothetical protein
MEHDSQPNVYCVHVWIRWIHPMLWRRFLVRSDSTLADLHAVLQIGFDWTDFHLHRFRIRKKDTPCHGLVDSAATMHGKSLSQTCAFASTNASCMSTISAISRTRELSVECRVLSVESFPRSLPVVWDARQDGVCAINLFQSDDQGHLVLEGEGTEGPEEVGGLSHPFGEPVRPTH